MALKVTNEKDKEVASTACLPAYLPTYLHRAQSLRR